jgi:hypothetical protein
MYKVTYLTQWTDESKNFINLNDAKSFAYEKGWSGKNDNYIKLVEYIPETKIKDINAR